jgi:sulfonate transport system substrate-binding protein
MGWLKRVIAVAVLSMSTVLAAVGATYGQDTVVCIGFQKNGTITQIRISDAARRPGT